MIRPEYMTQGGRRPRKVRISAGQDLATPKRPMTVMIDGKRERLQPGRSRLSLEHELVRARPDAFTACDTRDALTASELRLMVARSRQQARPTTTRTRRPGRSHWSLGPAPADKPSSWDL